MGSSGNVWVVLRIQQICNTTRHKSPIYGLFALSKRSQRDRKSNISNIQKTLRNFVFGGFLILKNENSFKFEIRIKKS